MSLRYTQLWASRDKEQWTMNAVKSKVKPVQAEYWATAEHSQGNVEEEAETIERSILNPAILVMVG